MQIPSAGIHPKPGFFGEGLRTRLNLESVAHSVSSIAYDTLRTVTESGPGKKSEKVMGFGRMGDGFWVGFG